MIAVAAPKPIRVALTGPMYSGKTTLANVLEREHHFININYTRIIKQLACDMLNAVSYAEFMGLGDEVNVSDIEAHKAQYRGFLQEIGTLCGFDNGGFVDKVCENLDQYPYGQAVFDNVRFESQYLKLKEKGFVLCRFVDPQMVSATRGVVSHSNHIAEQPVPEQAGEVHLLVGQPIEVHVAQILALGEQ
jgi:hypothetical protein